MDQAKQIQETIRQRDELVVRIANTVMARKLRPTTREIFEEVVKENMGFSNTEEDFEYFYGALASACHIGRLPQACINWKGDREDFENSPSSFPGVV